MCIGDNAYFCSGGETACYACYMLRTWKNFRFLAVLGIVLDF